MPKPFNPSEITPDMRSGPRGYTPDQYAVLQRFGVSAGEHFICRCRALFDLDQVPACCPHCGADTRAA
jgi:hypothetical protein